MTIRKVAMWTVCLLAVLCAGFYWPSKSPRNQQTLTQPSRGIKPTVEPNRGEPSNLSSDSITTTAPPPENHLLSKLPQEIFQGLDIRKKPAEPWEEWRELPRWVNNYTAIQVLGSLAQDPNGLEMMKAFLSVDGFQAKRILDVARSMEKENSSYQRTLDLKMCEQSFGLHSIDEIGILFNKHDEELQSYQEGLAKREFELLGEELTIKIENFSRKASDGTGLYTDVKKWLIHNKKDPVRHVTDWCLAVQGGKY